MKKSLNVVVALFALLALGSAGAAWATRVQVVDGETGLPIAGATVTVSERENRTDATGAVQFTQAGDRVLARAPGYRAAAVTTTQLSGSAGVLKLTPFQPHALYLTVYGIASTPLREGALALVRAGAVNALVIDLKGDRGFVPYPSPTALATAPGSRKITTIRDLPALVADLHRQGVYLIARIVVFKDDPLAAIRPDLAVKRADGGVFRDREGLAWTDPFKSDVRAYNIALAVEAAQAGFDEIQFDYLRFPDSSARLRLAMPSTSANRTQAISGFLAEAHQRLAPYNVSLAADIFGYVCWNTDDTGIGQQLQDVMPHVDYISPMLYPSGFAFGIPNIRNPVANSYAIVRQSLARAQARLNVSPKRFRPWLQAFRDYAFDRRMFDAVEVENQIRAATDFGSDGWMLWNAHNTYGDTGLAPASKRAASSKVSQSDSSSQSSCS